MRFTLAVLAFGFATAVLSQHDHGGAAPGRETSRESGAQARESRPPPQARLFGGEVRDLDKIEGTVTLKHEPIEALDIPARTMAYRLKDASMLDRLKPGDRVRFSIVQQGRELLVTSIAPAQ